MSWKDKVYLVRNPSYDHAVSVLIHCPIVKAMAQDVRDQCISLAHLGSWGFIQASLMEYTRRGGRPPHHIGAVAEAISEILGA